MEPLSSSPTDFMSTQMIHKMDQAWLFSATEESFLLILVRTKMVEKVLPWESFMINGVT